MSSNAFLKENVELMNKLTNNGWVVVLGAPGQLDKRPRDRYVVEIEVPYADVAPNYFHYAGEGDGPLGPRFVADGEGASFEVALNNAMKSFRAEWNRGVKFYSQLWDADELDSHENQFMRDTSRMIHGRGKRPKWDKWEH